MTAAPTARSEAASEGAPRGALALNGVTRRFGDYTAVDNVSFEIGPGELLALVGASGSGKTTTLRIAAGYETPDSGTVMLAGKDIPVSKLPAWIRDAMAKIKPMPVDREVMAAHLDEWMKYWDANIRNRGQKQ